MADLCQDLSDLGLVDVTKFELTELFEESA